MSALEPVQPDTTNLDDVHFDASPLTEVVLSAQFAPLAGLTTGHFGWYWKNTLTPEWTQSATTTSLPDQFEEFEEAGLWRASGIPFSFVPPDDPGRFQVFSADDERAIQVQRTRFFYNWRRRALPYPRHVEVRRAFLAHLAEFQGFLSLAGLGTLAPNQWEISYVNHFPKGGLWSTPSEWSGILPALLGSPGGGDALRLESAVGEWHFVIAPELGRVHVALQHARVASQDGKEVLQLQLTARGPLREQSGPDLERGIQLGHEACLRTFLRITSPSAQSAWKRRQT